MYLTSFPARQILQLAILDPHQSGGLQGHLPAGSFTQGSIQAIAHPDIDVVQPLCRFSQWPCRQAEAIAESSGAIQYCDFQITPQSVMLKAIITNAEINIRRDRKSTSLNSSHVI